jgi:Raf kinase inhibitor-like YbhB/YbcL family protein
VLVAAVLVAVGLAACGGGRGGIPDTIAVTSPAFAAGSDIPVRFSCEGDNLSPPLAWRGVSTKARSLAVVVEDPDAPSGVFVHWVLVGLDPRRTALAEGERPAGSTTGQASSEASEYVGPCPPDGQRHHYRFTVYALRRPAAPTVASITANATAKGTLVAFFGR